MKEYKRILGSNYRDKKEDKEEEEDDEPGGPPNYIDDQQKKKAKDLFDELFVGTKSETEKEIQNSNEKKKSKWEKLYEFMDKNNLEIASNLGMNSFFFTKIKGLNFGIAACKKFSSDYVKNLIYNYTFHLGSFYEIAIVIKPVIEAGICLELGTDIKWNEKEYSFYIDVYGMAETSLSLEFGVYVPTVRSPIQVSISLGIKGVLGSGKVGIKLSLFFGEERYDTKIYFELEACRYSFYILFKFSVDLKITSFSFEFYIFNKAFAGLKLEFHTTTIRKYNSKRIKTLEGGTLFNSIFQTKIKLRNLNVLPL